MNNLDIYNSVASVPENAKKPIKGGRLSGMTDINPMWRIKALTETFGVVGFGWKYTITDKRIVDGADGTKCAFVDIDLFVKIDDKWSDAIQGTGGSSYIAIEKGRFYTNDECFKMALTDAISVACKALGVGADVYWAGGRTKYSMLEDTPPQQDNFAPPPQQNYQQQNNFAPPPQQNPAPQQNNPAPPIPVCVDCGAAFAGFMRNNKIYDAYQAAQMASQMTPDGLPRCKACREKGKPKVVSINDI